MVSVTLNTELINIHGQLVIMNTLYHLYSQVQKASSQRPITAEPLQILPPIPSEYNDDIDPEHEYMIELAEAMVDLDSFDDKHHLTYRVPGKQPVNEHALKLN